MAVGQKYWVPKTLLVKDNRPIHLWSPRLFFLTHSCSQIWDLVLQSLSAHSHCDLLVRRHIWRWVKSGDQIFNTTYHISYICCNLGFGPLSLRKKRFPAGNAFALNCPFSSLQSIKGVGRKCWNVLLKASSRSSPQIRLALSLFWRIDISWALWIENVYTYMPK